MTYLADVFMWCWCWLAWRLVVTLPTWATHWAWDWLLPYAGVYAYHDPEVCAWRWSQRPSGRPSATDEVSF